MLLTGTTKAFEVMLGQKDIEKRLEVDAGIVNKWKARIAVGKRISTDKMEEMLVKGGATVHQEKIWNLVKESDEGKFNAIYNFATEILAVKINGHIYLDLSGLSNHERSLYEGIVKSHADMLMADILTSEKDLIIKYTFIYRIL